MTIGDTLTQGTKVISHSLHPMTVVADAKVALLEGAEPGIELQNTRLTIAEELSLDRKLCLAGGLRWFSNNLMEFGREGAEDPCHHDAIPSSPIDRWIGEVREDVVIEGIAVKREKYEVAPPLVVRRRGLQNDRDHRSYILEVGSLHVHVRGEGGIGVGAGVDGSIFLGSGELLFLVTDDDLLLLPSKSGDALVCPRLIQGLACSSYGSNESLLLSMRSSGDGLSRDGGVILLPLGGGGSRDDDLLLIDGEVVGAARQDRGG
jgi:hypothetical protein